MKRTTAIDRYSFSTVSSRAFLHEYYDWEKAEEEKAAREKKGKTLAAQNVDYVARGKAKELVLLLLKNPDGISKKAVMKEMDIQLGLLNNVLMIAGFGFPIWEDGSKLGILPFSGDIDERILALRFATTRKTMQ